MRNGQKRLSLRPATLGLCNRPPPLFDCTDWAQAGRRERKPAILTITPWRPCQMDARLCRTPAICFQTNSAVEAAPGIRHWTGTALEAIDRYRTSAARTHKVTHRAAPRCFAVQGPLLRPTRPLVSPNHAVSISCRMLGIAFRSTQPSLRPVVGQATHCPISCSAYKATQATPVPRRSPRWRVISAASSLAKRRGVGDVLDAPSRRCGIDAVVSASWSSPARRVLGSAHCPANGVDGDTVQGGFQRRRAHEPGCPALLTT